MSGKALRRSVQHAIPRCTRPASSRADFLRRRGAPLQAATLPYQAHAQRKQQQLLRSLLAIGLAGGAAVLTQQYLNDGNLFSSSHAEAPPKEEEPSMIFEESRKKADYNKEENRDMISSQHHQVKRSWESPGVYAWGSNTGRVVAPDSTENIVKTPRRLPFFNGMLLRDIKLGRNLGAAIDEQGDLLQWGISYAPDTKIPVKTLKGKDLIALCLSRDRILGLSSNGDVYSLPISAEDQETGPKPSESSWIPFWRGRSRVFSAAASSESFPNRGQLGIPGLTWATRPEGPYDQPHEVTTLRGFNIAKIACGDYHCLALDRDGRVFAWGDNGCGQLGFEFSSDSSIVDTPSLLPTQKLQEEEAKFNRGLGKISADTFAFGQGIYGGLANSRWTHTQHTPVKIPSLSGLFEYDEKSSTTVPIRLAYLSVGSTHAAAVMKNITYLSASDRTSTDDTNWGADIVFWGGNEHYQLGTGKRNNLNVPTYIQPLDMAAETARAKQSSGAREEHRFHITPRATAKLGDGRTVSVEQRVECGNGVTCVYSGT
ncbi:hypothetical protein M433DRAFT_61671 [Acidomyces richmondensis BFW]|nr:MAG: hypothetical protein FE78DRAFT_138357 [Acidomyces sp. 'richmondensis']KYG48180.1 hypothetical protein M433DRAFT_61671 [Acidomyces richmondensis BFW]